MNQNKKQANDKNNFQPPPKIIYRNIQQQIRLKKERQQKLLTALYSFLSYLKHRVFRNNKAFLKLTRSQQYKDLKEEQKKQKQKILIAQIIIQQLKTRFKNTKYYNLLLTAWPSKYSSIPNIDPLVNKKMGQKQIKQIQQFYKCFNDLQILSQIPYFQDQFNKMRNLAATENPYLFTQDKITEQLHNIKHRLFLIPQKPRENPNLQSLYNIDDLNFDVFNTNTKANTNEKIEQQKPVENQEKKTLFSQLLINGKEQTKKNTILYDEMINYALR